MHRFLSVTRPKLRLDRKSPDQNSEKSLDQNSISNVVMVKGHMGQRQMLIGSRSKVIWIKVSHGIMKFAGGLTSTSSCIFSDSSTINSM